MAAAPYPAIAAVTTGYFSSSDYHTVNTSALNGGHLYVVCFSWKSPHIYSCQVSGAWTIAWQAYQTGATEYTHQAVIYKIGCGWAGQDDLYVRLFEPTYSQWIMYDITNGLSVTCNHIAATGANPDPPMTASGSGEFAVIVSVVRNIAYTGNEVEPSGYSNLVSMEYGAVIHSAYKESISSQENPGAYSGMASSEYCSVTIRVSGWGEYIGGFTLNHPHLISNPVVTKGDYGIRTWAADGTLTMDTNYTQLLVVYTVTVGAAESDDVDIPAIDGKSVLIWTTLQDYLWATRVAPHTVTRSGTNIAWVPAASAPGITTIVVFIYD